MKAETEIHWNKSILLKF